MERRCCSCRCRCWSSSVYANIDAKTSVTHPVVIIVAGKTKDDNEDDKDDDDDDDDSSILDRMIDE
jgi:hypothetical protein